MKKKNGYPLVLINKSDRETRRLQKGTLSMLLVSNLRSPADTNTLSLNKGVPRCVYLRISFGKQGT